MIFFFCPLLKLNSVAYWTIFWIINMFTIVWGIITVIPRLAGLHTESRGRSSQLRATGSRVKAGTHACNSRELWSK